MMNNPEDLKYTKEHEWVKLNGDIATVGITDHAQELLTDIVFVELPEVGKEVKKDASLGVVESVKSVSDIFSPVTGTVEEINSSLEDSPEMVNEDAFGKGWIVKVKIKDKDEIEGLLSSKEYDDLIGNE
jgi:glycine cleavage system H protein